MDIQKILFQNTNLFKETYLIYKENPSISNNTVIEKYQEITAKFRELTTSENTLIADISYQIIMREQNNKPNENFFPDKLFILRIVERMKKNPQHKQTYTKLLKKYYKNLNTQQKPSSAKQLRKWLNEVDKLTTKKTSLTKRSKIVNPETAIKNEFGINSPTKATSRKYIKMWKKIKTRLELNHYKKDIQEMISDYFSSTTTEQSRKKYANIIRFIKLISSVYHNNNISDIPQKRSIISYALDILDNEKRMLSPKEIKEMYASMQTIEKTNKAAKKTTQRKPAAALPPVKTKPKKAATKISTKKETTKTIATGMLKRWSNFRNSPSTRSTKKIPLNPKTTKVQILENKGSWLKVKIISPKKYKDNLGYLYKINVKPTPIPAKSSSQLAKEAINEAAKRSTARQESIEPPALVPLSPPPKKQPVKLASNPLKRNTKLKRKYLTTKQESITKSNYYFEFRGGPPSLGKLFP
ncbi:hypothetical protein KKG71_00175, partial [Patescibacteria group bacterium]|nr:hypothetical protein [Patescibacteria group bacterium]